MTTDKPSQPQPASPRKKTFQFILQLDSPGGFDLIATLRKKTSALPPGDHLAGLQAVLAHIESAIRHLTRGRNDEDKTAFNDALYRANQAFEGSIKEAYRVLAARNPDGLRAHEIELYLQEHGVFRQRVLALFTHYRKEWRNPSTHDHVLTFDESEAFLAITSVASFACLVIDQIAETLALSEAGNGHYRSAWTKFGSQHENQPARPIDVIGALLELFDYKSSSNPIRSESQLYAAIKAFFAEFMPQLEFTEKAPFSHAGQSPTPIIAHVESHKILIVARCSNTRGTVRNAMIEVEYCMAISQIPFGIIYVHKPEVGELTLLIAESPAGEVHLLIPEPPREDRRSAEGDPPIDDAESAADASARPATAENLNGK